MLFRRAGDSSTQGSSSVAVFQLVSGNTRTTWQARFFVSWHNAIRNRTRNATPPPPITLITRTAAISISKPSSGLFRHNRLTQLIGIRTALRSNKRFLNKPLTNCGARQTGRIDRTSEGEHSPLQLAGSGDFLRTAAVALRGDAVRYSQARDATAGRSSF